MANKLRKERCCYIYELYVQYGNLTIQRKWRIVETLARGLSVFFFSSFFLRDKTFAFIRHLTPLIKFVIQKNIWSRLRHTRTQTYAHTHTNTVWSRYYVINITVCKISLMYTYLYISSFVYIIIPIDSSSVPRSTINSTLTNSKSALALCANSHCDANGIDSRNRYTARITY